MDTPYYLEMTREERRNYAALLAGQYVDCDDNNDGSDDDNNEEE